MATYTVSGDGGGAEGSPNGTYTEAGTNRGQPYYQRGDSAFVLWFGGIPWYISTATEVTTPGCWRKMGPTVDGSYDSVGTYTGTAVVALGPRTLYPTQDAGPTNWSASSWSEADDNAKDQVKPNDGDTIVFTSNSGAIALDENSANLVSLTMTGYASTLAMGTNDIDSAGDVSLDGTLTASAGAAITCAGNVVLASGMTLPAAIAWTLDATSGEQTITANSVTMGALTINDGAGDTEFALSMALACGAFVLTSGEFTTGGYDWTVGSISGTGGELVFSTSTVVASGDITLDNITATCAAADITAPNFDIGASGTLTVGGDFTTDADVEIDGGTLNLADNTWTQTNGNAFVHSSGTVTCTSDDSATIRAAGNTLSNITASNWIRVIDGVDGGGNTKLRFPAHGSAAGMMMGMMG